MDKETRIIVYDERLRLEAYVLQGFVRPFPNHFHDCYVIGLVEGGSRYLSCRNREYTLDAGDMVIFNPGDNHACAQCGSVALDYRAFNIKAEVMKDLAGEIIGETVLPGFAPNVITDGEAACYVRSLHEMVMGASCEFGREETLFLLVSLLLERYGQPFAAGVPEYRSEIEQACVYMERHYASPVYLDELCRTAGLSRSTLLRAFIRSKGVTPYRYLETIRINEAKKLLAAGVQPVEVAMRTGFADQSHFTNYFNRFTGLSPGMYQHFGAGSAGEEKHHERSTL